MQMAFFLIYSRHVSVVATIRRWCHSAVVLIQSIHFQEIHPKWKYVRSLDPLQTKKVSIEVLY